MTTAASSRAATGGWTLERGAQLVEEGVRFSVWAPLAREVAVRIAPRRGDGERDHALERDEHGVWSGLVRDAGVGTDYRFVLTDEEGEEKVLPDPVSRFQPEGVHGPSRVVDPHAFEWTDEAWPGIPLADYAIYEMHVGTFTDEGTFDAAIAHLPELVELGITAVEVMPIAQFPGERNWGYDGVGLYAVQNSYGGPEAFRRFVDAAHGHGLAVVLDVVYNHVGPEGNYLGSFGPYFTDKYKTPWGSAVNYDGPESDEVRRFVIDNARHWIVEYHVDGLRLDAVHGIFDFGATHVLRELAAAVRADGERLEREVRVIGESDMNDPRVIRDDIDAWGLDAQWSDDFHHAVHALLTEERKGYYEDFGTVEHLAKALRDRFVYDGRYSPHRKRRHGAPATDLPSERFVICVQNHDQVGNRATGDRLATLASFEQQKLAAALMLTAPYVPMLFMGEEWGETNPFQYFADHGDEGLIEAVRKGRREEFKAFGWGDDVPDPFAAETFRRSKLDRGKLSQPKHAALRALYRELLHLRQDEMELRPGGGEYRVTTEPAGDGVHGVIYTEIIPPDGGLWLGVFNTSPDEPAEVQLRGAEGRKVRRVLSTDERRFGGDDGVAATAHAAAGHGAGMMLPPSTAVLFHLEDA